MKGISFFSAVLLSVTIFSAKATNASAVSSTENFSVSQNVSPQVSSTSTALPPRLTANLTIDGDLTLQQNLYLDGFELQINGNLTHTSGQLYIGTGRLTVNGDYRIQQLPLEPEGPYRASDGRLQMSDAASYVKVQGNFVMQSNSSHSSTLQYGVLEVQGHFSQLATLNSNSSLNFAATRAHKVLLSGQNQQISFESDRSYFHQLEFAPGSAASAEFLSPITIRNNLITHGQPLPPVTGIINWTLTQNQEIAGSLNLLDGIINLAGQQLTINGNLQQHNGQMYINGGRLNVQGDYRIQQPPLLPGGPYQASDGRLDMRGATDYVFVAGDFAMQSNRTHLSLLYAGTLEVKGNFSQLRTAASGSATNFTATRAHKVLLSGQNQQVTFESAQSYFYQLEWAPGSAQSTQLNTPITVNHNIISHGQPLPALSGTINWRLEQAQLIEGDLQLTGGTINLGGRNLTINGNLIQEAGTLFINNGRLTVNGDYRIQQLSLIENGEYRPSDGRLQMTQVDDYVKVTGNFVMQSNQTHSTLLRAGTLEVQGNFSQLRTPNSASIYNFSASRDHKVLLSGQTEQQILIEAPESGFETLMRSNPVSVVFVNSVRISKPQQYQVTVAISSNAGSRVISFDGSFICDSHCVTFFEAGEVIMLRAQAFGREKLVNMPIDCFEDRGNCSFNVNQVRNLNFTFEESSAPEYRRSGLLKLLIYNEVQAASQPPLEEIEL